jgi:hypothetical protein
MHPAHMFTEKDLIAFRDDQQRLGAEHRKRIAEAESKPPAPKPPRVCPDAKSMRDYRTEFCYGTNWSQKLSEATAEEYRLEAREKELLSVAESLKGKRDEASSTKLRTIFGYDFRTNTTKHLDHPTMEHKDGLIDIVRNRLAALRHDMPRLVRAAQAYLEEQKNVPTEGQIFQQRLKEDRDARILQ